MEQTFNLEEEKKAMLEFCYDNTGQRYTDYYEMSSWIRKVVKEVTVLSFSFLSEIKKMIDAIYIIETYGESEIENVDPLLSIDEMVRAIEEWPALRAEHLCYYMGGNKND